MAWLPQLGLVEHEGDDPEDLQLLAFLRVYRRKIRVGWQQGGAGVLLQLLDGELAIQAGQHNGALARSDSPVDDQQVTIIDAFSYHAVPTGPHIEGGRRVLHADLVEVDGLLDVVLRRAGEATDGRREEQWQLKAVRRWCWDGEHGCDSLLCICTV